MIPPPSAAPSGSVYGPTFKDKLLLTTDTVIELMSVILVCFVPFINKLPSITTLPSLSIVNTFLFDSRVPKAKRTSEYKAVWSIIALLPNKTYEASGFFTKDEPEQSKMLPYPAIKALLTEIS